MVGRRHTAEAGRLGWSRREMVLLKEVPRAIVGGGVHLIHASCLRSWGLGCGAVLLSALRLVLPQVDCQLLRLHKAPLDAGALVNCSLQVTGNRWLRGSYTGTPDAEAISSSCLCRARSEHDMRTPPGQFGTVLALTQSACYNLLHTAAAWQARQLSLAAT